MNQGENGVMDLVTGLAIFGAVVSALSFLDLAGKYGPRLFKKAISRHVLNPQPTREVHQDFTDNLLLLCPRHYVFKKI